MNLNKLGLLGVAAAGAVAITVAHGAATEKKATTATPAKPAAATAKPAAPPKVPAPAAAADPHAGHDHAKPGATPGAAAFPPGPAGTAQVPELIHDAGTVERGTDIKHDFVIKNVGKHDLHVDAKPG